MPTNGEWYKTARERAAAFEEFCDARDQCEGCPLAPGKDMLLCKYAWLELEYAPIIEPCPFCGGEAVVESFGGGEIQSYAVSCNACNYEGMAHRTKNMAVAAHNRVAHAVMKENKNAY